MEHAETHEQRVVLMLLMRRQMPQHPGVSSSSHQGATKCFCITVCVREEVSSSRLADDGTEAARGVGGSPNMLFTWLKRVVF
ncbi:unnamed protein product [Knipowitschia caucasica]|uniref:Uncharacterized protein n=1 Tax=Knipowitschia caucasica TaxID=637954 RepID=A0AAV2LPV6_KNICA